MYPSILGKDAFAENRHSEPEKFRIAEKKSKRNLHSVLTTYNLKYAKLMESMAPWYCNKLKAAQVA